MAEVLSEENAVNARILYWGVPGCGITSNLQSIHTKLKASNRGELQRIPTRIDPTVEYEVLPIELGRVNGVRTRLHVVGAPSGPEQSPTRKHLLDRIDGIVFVVDSRPERLEENLLCLKELRQSLDDYGESPDDLPFVLQYNKCDLVDEVAIERLNRDLAMQGVATFDASANDGTGVLKTLTTISKQVVRALGKRRDELREDPPALPRADEMANDSGHPDRVAYESEAEPLPTSGAEAPISSPAGAFAPSEPALEPVNLPESAAPLEGETVAPERSSGRDLMEAAILAEGDGDDAYAAADATAFDAQAMVDETWDNLSKTMKPGDGMRFGRDLRIVSVGTAERSDERAVRLPLVLGNEDGETVTLALTLQLDLLLDDDA
jgi:hypothetical protein